MASLYRVLFVTTSCLLNIGTLLCLVVIGLACTKMGSHELETLNFFQIDIQNSRNLSTSNALGTTWDGSQLNQTYLVGIMGYCGSNNSNTTMNCMTPRAGSYFNVLKAMGEEGKETNISSAVRHSLRAYKTTSTWMQITYILAILLTAVQLLAALIVINKTFNRFVISLVSGAAFILLLAAATLTTVNFVLLKGILTTELKSHNISGTWGTRACIVIWFSVALSLCSLVSWTITTCCFSQARRGPQVQPYPAMGTAPVYHSLPPSAPNYGDDHRYPMYQMK
ncbi:hypothetical protein BO79DRAFT_133584 [Aspergillus costaricaensis CBS 115574]|uniref:Uncharacterized protein n=1 Tax=Aspergillus costaricaensis CBS 115574 TaxID=1448317 RepID=A0ACD1IV74_9EURO|nr:hypothetical protein BO79DRAFT_133584 [Aspergillus costaricaensis CBS 115574]RAK94340.1 hypothetical protein BO79DRAFT_133584 [Aspergillus costaricaensis CBS 115574]